MSNSKRAKRRSSRNGQSYTLQQTLLRCLITAIVSFGVFLVCTAFLCKFYLQKGGDSMTFRILMPVFCGLSFLLCGFLITARGKSFGGKVAFIAGFMQLIFLLLVLLAATGGKIDLFILLPVGLGLVLPLVGGYLGKRV